MPFLCVCGSFAVKKKVRVRQKKMLTDFRRADRRFVNFVPKTCVDAIDLFTRHRDMGLSPGNYPECFVHCARALPDEELDKFHRFIVNPNGDIQKGGRLLRPSTSSSKRSGSSSCWKPRSVIRMPL